MCIIAAKARGLNMPSESRIDSMWRCNPDGAGLMVFSKKRGIEIYKGYMTLESFKDGLSRIDKMLNLKECDVVMHFRYGTHGGISQGLTHPFSLSDDFDNMKELYNRVTIGVAHNGVYNYASVPGISDSMMYIKEKIYPLYKKDKRFYKSLDTKYYGVLQGKLCFLTKEGIYTVGEFYKDRTDGILYSNDSYLYYDYDYGYYDDYDEYEDYDSILEDFEDRKHNMVLRPDGRYEDSEGNVWTNDALLVGDDGYLYDFFGNSYVDPMWHKDFNLMGFGDLAKEGVK